MTKQIIAVISIICLLIFAPTAVAINAEMAELTVIVAYDKQPLKGISITICKVADAKIHEDKLSFDIIEKFAQTRADFSNLFTQKNIALATALHTYAVNNNVKMTEALTNNSGEAIFKNLTAGLYLVTQAQNDSSNYKIAPYLVMAPTIDLDNNEKWQYKVISYPKTEPVPLTREFDELSVLKVWKGTENDLPKSISVQLLRDGKPHGKAVVLNAEKVWAHTWKELDKNYTWTVDEPVVPSSFKKSISGNMQSGYIITNEKEKPSTSAYSSSKMDTPTGGERYFNPKTGDYDVLVLWVVLIIASLAIAVILIKKSKHILGR